MDELGQWLVLLRLLLFVIVGSCILIFAFLEMIFAPVMVFKYMKPALIEHLSSSAADSVNKGADHPATMMISLFYGVHLFVQATNFFAALSLFFGIMHSEFRERWLAFDVGGLLSVALLGSLAVGGILVTSPTTESNSLCALLERDIYTRAILVGDSNCNGKTCFRTDVFLWHQERQCCGWRSPVDAAAVASKGMSTPPPPHSNNESALTLPQFCCFQDLLFSEGILLGSELINNNGHSRRAPVVFYSFTGAQQKACKLGSMNRFRETCSAATSVAKMGAHVASPSFFALSSVSMLVHPCSWMYILFKLFFSLAYTAVKKHYFVPQAEGIYADEFA